MGFLFFKHLSPVITAKFCGLNYSIFLVYLENLVSNRCCVMGVTVIQIVLLVQGAVSSLTTGLFYGALTSLPLWGQAAFLSYGSNLAGLKD